MFDCNLADFFLSIICGKEKCFLSKCLEPLCYFLALESLKCLCLLKCEARFQIKFIFKSYPHHIQKVHIMNISVINIGEFEVYEVNTMKCKDTHKKAVDMA